MISSQSNFKSEIGKMAIAFIFASQAGILPIRFVRIFTYIVLLNSYVAGLPLMAQERICADPSAGPRACSEKRTTPQSSKSQKGTCTGGSTSSIFERTFAKKNEAPPALRLDAPQAQISAVKALPHGESVSGNNSRAGGSVLNMVPGLEISSPTPVSNCRESGGNNRPTGAGEKGFQADVHQPSNNSAGGENLGTEDISSLPGRTKEMGKAVRSGGPVRWSGKNLKSKSSRPHKGTVSGGFTLAKFISAFGETVDWKQYLMLAPEADGPDSTKHTEGGWADNQSPAGLNCMENGQGEAAVSVPNSQTVPVSGQWAGILAAVADSFMQQAVNPRGWAKVAKGAQQVQNAQNSDNQANCCRQNCQNSFHCMKLPLINVANEAAAAPCSSEAAFKDEANVVWMVQQMYKNCYVPMAILFLLPGAAITQAKSLVAYNIGSHDDDSSGPFVGIVRSIIAIFLIPATQLVLSYCIDIGNALSEPVAQEIQLEALMAWVQEQAYASDPKNNDGCIKNVAANMGKLAGTPSKSVVQERQNDLNVTVQNTFNTVNSMLSQGLEVLNGFQIVMMCYLFLLGPIAAAFYAWPAAVGRRLFKKAFASWLDGVVVLSLWKFWWCIVLLCMVVRLQAGNVNPSSQYEMYYFTAFMTILLWVPFQPFEFRPGDMVDKLLERAQQGGVRDRPPPRNR